MYSILKTSDYERFISVIYKLKIISILISYRCLHEYSVPQSDSSASTKLKSTGWVRRRLKSFHQYIKLWKDRKWEDTSSERVYIRPASNSIHHCTPKSNNIFVTKRKTTGNKRCGNPGMRYTLNVTMETNGGVVFLSAVVHEIRLWLVETEMEAPRNSPGTETHCGSSHYVTRRLSPPSRRWYRLCHSNKGESLLIRANIRRCHVSVMQQLQKTAVLGPNILETINLIY